MMKAVVNQLKYMTRVWILGVEVLEPTQVRSPESWMPHDVEEASCCCRCVRLGQLDLLRLDGLAILFGCFGQHFPCFVHSTSGQ